MAKTSARREASSKNTILDYAMLAGWIFGIGGLLVRHAEFIDEALQAGRLLERIEVFALDVFDQRHG